MPGRVPGIHVFANSKALIRGWPGQAHDSRMFHLWVQQ